VEVGGIGDFRHGLNELVSPAYGKREMIWKRIVYLSCRRAFAGSERPGVESQAVAGVGFLRVRQIALGTESRSNSDRVTPDS
jgi:hypothetical protein